MIEISEINIVPPDTGEALAVNEGLACLSWTDKENFCNNCTK